MWYLGNNSTWDTCFGVIDFGYYNIATSGIESKENTILFEYVQVLIMLVLGFGVDSRI
jgi:hypothetical protein